jgi:hypothetical protein
MLRKLEGGTRGGVGTIDAIYWRTLMEVKRGELDSASPLIRKQALRREFLGA